MIDELPVRTPLHHKSGYHYAVLVLTILGAGAGLVQAAVGLMQWLHIEPEQLPRFLQSISKFVEPVRPYVLPVLLLALIYWTRAALLRLARKIAQGLIFGYVRILKFLLRPVLHGQEAGIGTGFFYGYPFEIKFGELEFEMAKGEPYRQEKFIFDKPFRELPNIYITESTGGDWLLVKVDEKDVQSFTWAARRSVFPQVSDKYAVRLQWVAIAPNFSTQKSGTGQLVIHNASYGIDGLSAVLTSQLRSKIRNDAVNEICGNHLGGDPRQGKGKILTIDYSFRDQRKLVTIGECGPIKLP